MADILSVIQDVLTQDKQQKKEHAKMMREVQKKLKEKDSEEVSEEEGDGDKYEAFVRTMLKKFGVKSPAELAPDKKKEFYDALDAGWKADDEKPEKDESLEDRVKARMEQEDEEEEDDEGEQGVDDPNDMASDDEDEAPVGDQDEPETEPEGEDEPPEEQIDKIADLVLQKLKDKADEEEDEEEAPEPTEAQGGKEEKIDTKPKMEAWESSANPHARYKWLEALRQVNEHCGVCGEQGIEEVRDHKGEIPEPIKPVIQSFGKKLLDYAKKSGGMDRDLFLGIAKDAMAGKLPNPKYIWKQDTAARDFVLDSMAKEFGWMYVEDKYNTTFRNRRDYVEQVELAISEALDQSKVDGRRRAFREAIRHLIYRKMKEASRQQVKEWWDVTLREDWIEDELIDKLLSKNRARAAKIFNSMKKRDKMKYLDKVQSITSRHHDYTDLAVVDALDDHGIDISKEARKQWEEVEIDESTGLQLKMAFGDAGIKIKKVKNGKLVIDRNDQKKVWEIISKEMKKPADAKRILGGMVVFEDVEIAEAFWKVDITGMPPVFIEGSSESEVKMGMKKKLKPEVFKELMVTKVSRTDMTKMYRDMAKGEDIGEEHKTDKKTKDKTGIGKNTKPTLSGKPVGAKGPIGQPKPDEHITKDGMKSQVEDYLITPDKTGTSKTNPSTKAIPAGKGKGGDLDAGTVKKIEGDNPNKLSTGTKSGKPKKAVGDAKKAKIVDPIGKGEKGFKKEEVSFKEKLDNWGIGLKKEGYMILPGIDRERYTEMRGLEGPFMTRSGKVVYYDSKLGEYYDRDSDIYLSWEEYQSLDHESPAQKAAMKQGVFDDPKSQEFKKMVRDKMKAEKAAKKQSRMRSESLGVARARKFYQKDDEMNELFGFSKADKEKAAADSERMKREADKRRADKAKAKAQKEREFDAKMAKARQSR